MKTEEDEAFDDLAKKQGSWGGGFKAKRAMAADKVQEPWNEDEWRRNNWRCGHGWLRGEQCEICNAAQPAQEPTALQGLSAYLRCEAGGEFVGSPNHETLMQWAREVDAARAQPAQEPVALVVADYALHWVGSGSIEPLIKKHGIKVGDKLYTGPPLPAQEPVAWVREWIYIGDEKYYRLYDEEKDCRSDEKGYGGVCRPLVYGDTTPPAVQPAQAPPSGWESIGAILDEYGLQAIDFVADFKAALAGREWNFCERCGKRSWVGLTYAEIKKICDCTHGYDADERIARAVEQLLKEKNT